MFDLFASSAFDPRRTQARAMLTDAMDHHARLADYAQSKFWHDACMARKARRLVSDLRAGNIKGFDFTCANWRDTFNLFFEA